MSEELNENTNRLRRGETNRRVQAAAWLGKTGDLGAVESLIRSL
jgi:hypothetical protein